MSLDKQILVVEDRAEEAKVAEIVLREKGLIPYFIANNLKDALTAIPNSRAILTDLFFPLGGIPHEEYSKRFLPHYEAFADIRYKKNDRNNPLVRAVEQVSGLFGITAEQYVEKIAPLFNHSKKEIDMITNALAERENFDKYQKYLGVIESVRNGTNLPLGIIVAEEARKLGIPTVIVTSTNHHDDAFEAVRSLAKVQYVDHFVNGRKAWKYGAELLMQEMGGASR
jgi:CheY-like chemotaxis protein